MNKKVVTVIPATKTRTSVGGMFQTLKEKHTHLRVAAYCRVSSDKDIQEVSFDHQVREYTRMITENPNWTLVKVYADEGRSGTTRKKRVQFNAMMRDALSGKIDYIITKSISRFSRNQMDMYECIKSLRDHKPPVGVFFENENIDSLDMSKDFIFSILSMVAQDQSRSISDNVKWAIEKRFREGDVLFSPDFLIGYKRGKNGEWLIDEEAAKVVRRIYQRYLECGNFYKIAVELNKDGIQTRLGNIWRTDSVATVLRNEKYCGDVLQQKTFKESYLAHYSVENKGERPQYYIKDHHPAIVSRELWDAVQERIRKEPIGRKKIHRQKAGIKKQNYRVKLFSVLCCGKLKAAGTRAGAFQRIARQMRSKNQVVLNYVWYCHEKLNRNAGEKTKACENCRIILAEMAMEQSFMEMLYVLKREYEEEKDQSYISKAFHIVMEKTMASIDETSLAEELAQSIEETEMLIDSRRRFLDQRSFQRDLGYSVGVKICDKMLDSIDSDIQEHEIEQEKIQNELGRPGFLKNEFTAFLNAIECLPEENQAGMPIQVNRRDVMGSAMRTLEGKAITCYLPGSEIVQRAPDFLSFEPEIFRRFITAGVVEGDTIIYDTTFGVRLYCKGNSRCNRDFRGFRYVLPNRMITYARNYWEVLKLKTDV